MSCAHQAHTVAPTAEAAGSLHVALLLSMPYFEEFYGSGLGLTRAQYLREYRNDWSWDWCTMLAGADVRCSIYVPTIERGALATTAEGFAVRFLPLGAAVAPWVRFSLLGRTPVGRYLEQAVNARAFLAPLRAGLRADGVDVLCVQEYWTARFDVLARTVDRPVVAVDQGVPDAREIKLLKRGSFSRCRGIVVQTDREAAKVGRYGATGRRIPNAVDTSIFSPGRGAFAPAEPVVLCVGRLHDRQKRVSDVIRALALLPSAWRLEIVGTGPDRPRLEQLATSLGIADRITYLGFISDPAELARLYRRAAALALPSAYEGLPMVLLEAMSCGTPVVGSDIAAIAEVVQDGRTGVLVPVGAPDRLAAALLEAAERRAELGAAARQTILDTYDQAVVAPRLAGLLHDAARPASRAV